MRNLSTKQFLHYLFEQTEPVAAGDSEQGGEPDVEFPDWLNDKIKTVHGTPGQGSIFANPESVKDIVLKTVQENKDKIANIATTTGALKSTVSGIGYDLVIPTEEAKGLPGAEMGETEKVEGPNKLKVPSVKTTAPMQQFSTDELTVIVRPKKDESGKVIPNKFIILSAFPGKDLPRTSEWDGKYAIVIPAQTGQQQQLEGASLTESSMYQELFEAGEGRQEEMRKLEAIKSRLEDQIEAIKDRQPAASSTGYSAEDDDINYGNTEAMYQQISPLQAKLNKINTQLDTLYKKGDDAPTKGEKERSKSEGEFHYPRSERLPQQLSESSFDLNRWQKMAGILKG